MIEKLFASTEYGVGGICVLLTILILQKVAVFVWGLIQKKEQVTDETMKDLIQAVEENTEAQKSNTVRIAALEKEIHELPKFKTDMRRFYAAIKEIAGEDWPRVRDEILKDDFTF